jgi:hypothetical protein
MESVLTTASSWPWPDSRDAVLAAPESRVLFENEHTRVLEVRATTTRGGMSGPWRGYAPSRTSRHAIDCRAAAAVGYSRPLHRGRSRRRGLTTLGCRW